ncbi:HD domain-containing protein [bacterium]|nr:HD domain-containing protein [bacterium]
MFSTEAIYEILNFSIGDTKAGTKMGKLQLKNTEDNSILNCILWEETLNRFDSKVFRCGNLVRIVSATFNEKFNNCLISALEVKKEAKMGLDENEREKAFAEVLDYINSISDEKLQNFLAGFFAENAAKIKVAPAAKVMHHNYIGGLLVHTLEVIKFAELNMDHFLRKFNKDNVIAACILHDIGKIFEYKINLEDGLIDYDEDFRKDWITHSQYGFTLCMNNGFKEIARMIAAHHGRADWGAIIDLNEKDLEPELYLIHIVDNLSAKFGKTNVAMLEQKEAKLG